MPHHLLAPIVEQHDLGQGYFLMAVDAAAVARAATPASFVMVGLPRMDILLLRRPFSIARTRGDHVEILYKVVGRGTELFSRMGPGDTLSVLGPLGRGFRISDDREGEHLLVAGGIGNAPFPLLVEHLERQGRQTTFFFGGRTRSDLTLLDWFESHCHRVVTTTEDGSLGRKGLVTEPLAEYLDGSPRRRATLYACGPVPMLRAVRRLAIEHGVQAQFSLEERMACGFGVCLGCVVPVRDAASEFDRYRRVCAEGPVFDAAELDW
jgi:dihydroorotate dehydrogenase electron transfer subunit